MSLPFKLEYDDVLLVPEYSGITSRKEVILRTQVTRHCELRLPLVSAPMDTVTGEAMAHALAKLGGLGVIHRYCSIQDQVVMVSRSRNPIEGLIGAAIGTTGDYKDRFLYLLDAGVDIILVDVAHADHILTYKALEWLVAHNNGADLMVGNVATPEATERLIDAGADCVRVGIGGGSHCTTRIEAGCGVPQFSAVQECAEIGKERGVPICADGGIRFAGDIVKALAVGATTAMCGNLFAGTTETPGPIYNSGFGKSAKQFKEYRGQASSNSKRSDNRPEEHIEGISTLVPYKGPVEDIIDKLVQGVRSGFSYAGARTIDELHKKAKFVRVSQSASHLYKMDL